MICRTCLRASRASSPVRPTQTPTRASTKTRTFLHMFPRAPIILNQPHREESAAPTKNITLPMMLPTRSSTSSSTTQLTAVRRRLHLPSSLPSPPDNLTEGERLVRERLVAALAPTELVVCDISGGCGSMYSIQITSPRFVGTTLLKQQRMVNAALGEMVKKWHGVQIRTRAPV